MVIMHHLSLSNHVFSNLIEIKYLRPFIEFIQDGHLGVNIFFVISGFLITSLMLQEEINTKTISLKNFYIRRTLRIFPAYYFLLIIYFFLQLLNFVKISDASWLTAITYTKYINWELDWYTSHAWSLSIEEQFYIFWPIIFLLTKRFRKGIIIAIIIIVPLIRLYVYINPIDWINDLTIFKRIDAIAIGCFFAFYKNNIIKIFSRHWTKLFYSSILCLFLLSYLPKIINNVYLNYIIECLGTTYGSVANFLIALILMYSVFGPRKIWYKILNSKLFNGIGLLSYSLYLWQQVFNIPPPTHWVLKFPQNLVFIIFMALFSYYVIEKPFLKLKSRFSKYNFAFNN